MTDQLERELEQTLARLAERAVPDARPAPAPPWHAPRRRVTDIRRFGRATPWLVAAVLLVIAGLGIGASVAFDASGRPDHGPVGTQLPTPTGTTTAPDGTLGTPVTGTPTPTSHPTLARSTDIAAPDENETTPATGPFVAGLGSYGPVQAGMTQAQALAALGLTDADLVAGFGPSCQHAVPMPGRADPYRTIEAVVDETGVVAGFVVATDAADADGNTRGTTLRQLQASYPTGTVNMYQGGYVFAVVDGDRGLGFALSTPDDFSREPVATDTVVEVLPGSAAFARGGELCVG